MIGELTHVVIALGGNRNHARRLLFETFDIGNILFITQHRSPVVAIARRNNNYGKVLID